MYSWSIIINPLSYRCLALFFCYSFQVLNCFLEWMNERKFVWLGFLALTLFRWNVQRKWDWQQWMWFKTSEFLYENITSPISLNENASNYFVRHSSSFLLVIEQMHRMNQRCSLMQRIFFEFSAHQYTMIW